MHMVWCGIMAVGISYTCSSGFLIMAKLFVDKKGFAAILCLISGVLWAINGIATAYLMKIAHYNLGIYLAQKYQKYDENQNKGRTY